MQPAGHADQPPVQLKQFGPLPVTGGKDCQAVTHTPRHQETFSVGQGVSVTAFHTPCHTQDSICYLFQDGDDRAVFTGDTLFIGGGLSQFRIRPNQPGQARPGQTDLVRSILGCGRFFEGTAEEMHRALNDTLASLPDDTKVFVRSPIRGKGEGGRGGAMMPANHILISSSIGSSLATSIPKPTSSSPRPFPAPSRSGSCRTLSNDIGRRRGSLPWEMKRFPSSAPSCLD